MKKFAETPFLPTEVEIEAISANEAKITAYPFEDGFAITLAHPLRRLLLSSSVGYAPIAVKIEVSVVNAIAGKPFRSFTNRPTNSAARC